MKQIKVLGTGCSKCKQLAAVTQQVADKLGIDYQLEKVTDVLKFADFGVMSTPALVVDGVVKVAGKVPTVAELERLLA